MKTFWSKVDKSGECWVWTGSRNPRGYGNYRYDGKTCGAHRISWMLAYGAMPELYVLHKCDNRSCVRPDHLFLGTQQENIADMVGKGRSKTCGNAQQNVAGEKNVNAFLTEENIREIRAAYGLGELQASLAARYDTSQGNISLILSRKAWAHVK